jgi:hypothetical protein
MMSVYKGYTTMAFGVFGSGFRTPDINTIALSRCDAIMTAMRLASAMEPQSAAQVELAERELDRAKEGLDGAKRAVAKTVGWSVLAYFVLMGLAAFWLSSIGDNLSSVSFEPTGTTMEPESSTKSSDGKAAGK